MERAVPEVNFFQREEFVPTTGRGTYDVTGLVGSVVEEAALQEGMVNVFVRHTSASLIICENADPSVRHDLESFAARWAPDGAEYFTHTAEGPDDMSAHIRSVFTQTSLQVPVSRGTLALGTWQGIYLWEHRTSAHRRRVIVSCWG